ncbi:MAG: FAD-dependent oxidoreductase [Verrucomicrobia bacterium]|nr:FAD-dependent oxidoreductase [Verrucomicrobiota bacterium]
MEKYPIIVIGSGAAGLVVANGAAKAGKKVLIIEKKHWGGDCTNFGCIPSKSLIASSHAAYAILNSKNLGIHGLSGPFNADDALERVRTIVAQIRAEEDKPALEKNGVDALEGTASFVDPHTIKIIGKESEVRTIWGKQIVIATGSAPNIPFIQGLAETPYLTNETIFDLKKVPKSLVVVGVGPIGCEIAQAMRRLGSSVIIIGTKAPLPREEPQAQQILTDCFKEEGIELLIGYATKRVAYREGKFEIFLQEKGSDKKVTLQSDALLVAAGRSPNLASLNLNNAGVLFSEKGIPVDRFGRTNQKHIWAIGDAAGAPFFTHYAESQARSVLTSLLLPFGIKKSLNCAPVPRVTYTDPEIASIGLLEQEALQRYKARSIAVYHVPFTKLDRAITAGRTEGFVKIITKKWSSKILGATIVAPRAGEMLMQIATAMQGKIPLRKLSSMIHPYPTYSLAIRKASDLWLTQTVLPTIKKTLGKSS